MPATSFLLDRCPVNKGELTDLGRSILAADERPFGLAFAGLGGFAALVTNLTLEQDPSVVRVVSVGDPAAERHAERAAELRERGIAVLDDFVRAAEQPGVDGVWLPVPIGLHRPFAEAAYARGKAVLCEKPLAGCLTDVDAMMAARDAAGLPGAVGFHDCFDPEVLAIKRRLMGGELGELESATVFGSWPRDRDYFARAAWAGRLRLEGVWVRDSPINNAMAHYLMLMLFLLGDDDLTAAQLRVEEARTFAAAEIESFDTVSLAGAVADGSPWRGLRCSVHLTHAGERLLHPQILLRGTRGSWLWKLNAGESDLVPADEVFVSRNRGRPLIPLRFAALCRGVDCPDLPYASFEAARAHASVVEQVADAGPVQRFEPGLCREIVTDQHPAGRAAVPGLIEALRQAALDNQPLPTDWRPAASSGSA